MAFIGLVAISSGEAFGNALGVLLLVGVVALARGGGGSWLMRIGSGWWVAGLVVLALAVRVATVLAVPYAPAADFEVYHNGGIYLLQTGKFGNGYRAFFPPGQVFTLSVVYRLLGTNWLWAQLLNCVWGALTVVALGYLASLWFTRYVGRVSALLLAVMPSMAFGCLMIGAEVPQTLWLVLGLCFYTRAYQGRGGRWEALAAGIMLGIGTLIRPTYALLWIPLGIHAVLMMRPKLGGAKVAAGLLLGTAAVVAPWTFRNYQVCGGFLLISSNGGGNFYSANNEGSDGGYTDAAWKELFATSKTDLELHANGKRLALEWVKANPGRFAYLMVRRIAIFWGQEKAPPFWAMDVTAHEHPKLALPVAVRNAGRGATNMFYLGLLVLGAIGLWRWREVLRMRKGWLVIPLMCGYFTGIHMIFEAQDKYHFMLLALLCPLAALAVAKAGPGGPAAPSRSQPEQVAAVA
jgi:4-amino-4-deoxy-L-arabinose transferase-like glycosyltransferase